MTKNPSTNRNSRFRVARARIAPAAVVLVTQAVSLLAVGILYYVIAFFAAVRIVPFTLGFVKDGTGVTMDMPFEAVLGLWIAPALFLLALVFWLVVTIMRRIWTLRASAVNAVKAWAFGREDAIAVPSSGRARLVSSRKPKSA